MFEYFFGKKNTDRLVDSIADKTADKIAKTVTDKSKQNGVTEIDSLEIKKKELEIALLQMDKQKREQEIKNKPEGMQGGDGKSFPESPKSKWYEFKVGGRDFREILFAHKESKSPQAIQGMWQAYGQMRANRITAIGAVLATGMGGAALWFFQQKLSQQKSNLEQQARELEQQQDDVKKAITLRKKFQEENTVLYASLNLLDGEMAETDKFVKALCNEDNNCLGKYAAAREKGKNEARKALQKELEQEKSTLQPIAVALAGIRLKQ